MDEKEDMNMDPGEEKRADAGRIVLRRMRPEDTETAAKIEEKLFSKPWSRQALMDALRRDDSLYAVAQLDGQIIGYCGLYSACGEGFINQVGVDEAWQGLGIGKKMLAFLFDEARKEGITTISLEVRLSNERAIGLYQSLGLVSQGVRPGFYEAPVEDALIMTGSL